MTSNIIGTKGGGQKNYDNGEHDDDDDNNDNHDDFDVYCSPQKVSNTGPEVGGDRLWCDDGNEDDDDDDTMMMICSKSHFF